MRSAADIASELDEGLKQLFDGGLQLALHVQANAMAAEPAVQARLAIAFHRLSRGVRQTAALRMKLAREAERAVRETTAEIISLEKRRLERRKGQVKAAIQSLIWTEAEPDDSTFNLDLEELLDIETQDPETFQAEDLEDQVQRFAIMLGLGSSPSAERDEGEVSSKMTEGVAAHEPDRPASQPPQSLRDSSPSGGASAHDDALLSDDDRSSSV